MFSDVLQDKIIMAKCTILVHTVMKSIDNDRKAVFTAQDFLDVRRALNEIVGDLTHLRVDVGVRLHQEYETQNKKGKELRHLSARISG